MKNIILKIIFVGGIIAGIGILVHFYNSSGVPDVSVSDSISSTDQTFVEASSTDDQLDDLADIQSVAQTLSKKTTKKASKNIAQIPVQPVEPLDVSVATGPSTSTQGANVAGNESATALAVNMPSKLPLQVCSFSTDGLPSHKIILNEIAWMGSLVQDGQAAVTAAANEWIELKNNDTNAVDLTGWQILGAKGSLKITIGTTTIGAGGLYVFNRANAAKFSGALSNAGDELAVFDANCAISDLLDASTGWPGGNNTTKQTLERNADLNGWHTSLVPGGTPGIKNSIPVSVPIVANPSTSIVLGTPQKYLVTVSMTGDGVGTISSAPTGILCGFTCQANYASGTKIIFTEMPAAASIFRGWSGACSGTALCSIVVSSSVAIVAEFGSVPVNQQSQQPVEQPSPQAPTSTDPLASSPSSQPDHLVLAQVQIAGASSTNDFVKIFNPTNATVDLGGWKLHKKSGTGTDYSLRTFQTGSVIPADSYFTWANSTGGFADAIGANVSSSETLSAENSVALFDASGTIVDQVAWGTGTNQYGEGTAYPTDPIAGQILTRIVANGSFSDTDNNAADFSIQ